MYPADKAQQSSSSHASYTRQAGALTAHSAYFYDHEAVFLDSLSEFAGAALGAGGACVVVATDAHRRALAEDLKAGAIDVQQAIAMHRLIALDASETLARFMVDGHPDESRFVAVIEPELLRAAKGSRRESAPVVAFSELAAVLCREGKREAAIELEGFWQRLARRHAVSVHCAYPVELFSDQAQSELLRQVYAIHDKQDTFTTAKAMTGCDEEMARFRDVEARLRQCAEFARIVVDGSGDCVKVLDLEGRLQSINPAGGCAAEIDQAAAMLGRRWVELWSLEDRPRAEAAVAAAREGRAGRFTGESLTGRGNRKWWDAKITPGLDADGRIERLIVVSRDISELRLAQQVAIEAERQATAGRIAATVVHEINNPLEAVTNFIYLASTTEGLPAEAGRHLEIADREMARVAHITRQTLGYYRGGSRSKWVSVGELIQDVLTIYSRKLRNKQLTTSISMDPSLQVFGKDGELRQVLLNLTANAVDASQPGGKLWFRARRTRNWKTGLEDGLRITLADNGSGMTPEVQRHIFVPFFTTKSGTGTGLGLWVTKCLIEQQGGFVHFRSRQGEKAGTVMSLFLPLARNASQERAEVA